MKIISLAFVPSSLKALGRRVQANNRLFCLSIYCLFFLLISYCSTFTIWLQDDQYASYILGNCGIEFKECDVLPGEPEPFSTTKYFCDSTLKINYFYPFYTMHSEPGLQNLAIAYQPLNEGPKRRFLTRCQDFYEGLTLFNELRPLDGWFIERYSCGKAWFRFLNNSQGKYVFALLPGHVQTAVLELVTRVTLIQLVNFMDMIGIFPVRKYSCDAVPGKPFFVFEWNLWSYEHCSHPQLPLKRIWTSEVMKMKWRLLESPFSAFYTGNHRVRWTQGKEDRLLETAEYFVRNLRGHLPNPVTSEEKPLTFVTLYLHFLRNSVQEPFFLYSLHGQNIDKAIEWWKAQPARFHEIIKTQQYEEYAQLLSSLGKIVADPGIKPDDDLDLANFPESLGLKRVDGEIELIVPETRLKRELAARLPLDKEMGEHISTTGPWRKATPKKPKPWYSYVLSHYPATAAAVLLPTVTVTAFLALKLITKISHNGL